MLRFQPYYWNLRNFYSHVLFCCLIGGSDVTQNETLWKYKGNSATIDCTHTKGPSYFYMYWYRQLPGETMKQIVFTSINSKDFGNFSTVKFSATKPDAASGTFTVKNLEPEDKGLYFCAVSEHSDTDALNS
uniref:Ig-like domain-containing protein n=1 Tax=Dicentrarchus labrax TaxID=13489 RepID=A0A8P4G9Z9_DICLA